MISFKKKEKKESSDDHISSKFFLIDNIIAKELDERPLSFYKKRYKNFTSGALFFAFLTFILSSIGHIIIVQKNTEQKTFLSNTLGQNKEYEQTENRKKIINKTLQYQRNKK